jgi:hypothetical protein
LQKEYDYSVCYIYNEVWCSSFKESNTGWSKSEVPVLRVESDSVTGGARQTVVTVDTKSWTRWLLGINKEEIDDFTVEGELNH